jgi:hypothetical protein
MLENRIDTDSEERGVMGDTRGFSWGPGSVEISADKTVKAMPWMPVGSHVLVAAKGFNTKLPAEAASNAFADTKSNICLLKR